MATGEIRAAFSLSEPELGSDVSRDQDRGEEARGRRLGDQRQKMWVTNGLRSGLVFVLVRTDPSAEPRHRGLTCFIGREGAGRSQQPGLTVAATDPQARLQGSRVDRARLRQLPHAGGQHSRRRGVGARPWLLADDGTRSRSAGSTSPPVASGSLSARSELALRYAQQRVTFGKPIAEHQAIQFKLADMVHAGRGGTPFDAARSTVEGRRRALGHGGRHGEAVRFPRRPASGVEESFRIHGGLRLLGGSMRSSGSTVMLPAADRRGQPPRSSAC